MVASEYQIRVTFVFLSQPTNTLTSIQSMVGSVRTRRVLAIGVWGYRYLWLNVFSSKFIRSVFPSPYNSPLKSFLRLIHIPLCRTQITKNTITRQPTLFNLRQRLCLLRLLCRGH